MFQDDSGVVRDAEGSSADREEKGSKKSKWISIGFWLIFFPIIGVFFHEVLKMPGRGGVKWVGVHSKCEELGRNLGQYCQDCNEKSKPIEASEFIFFLKDKYSESLVGYLEEAPFEQYISEADFGIYLCFSDELEYETAVLIGHTNLIQDSRREFGIVFTLNGGEIETEMLVKDRFVFVVGEERLNSLKPDFYFWGNMRNYLVDKTMEKEETD